MKRMIAGLLALSLLLAGCAVSDSETERTVYDPTTSTEILSGVEEPQQPDAPERFALSYFPEAGFNPFSCGNLTNRTVLSLLYETLFLVTADFSVEPVLCESFTVSEDQQVYTLKLVEGVTFSDGTPLTAEDVVASIQEARQSRYYISRLEHISSLRAVDAQTVRIGLDLPYENLPLVLDIPILQKDTVEAEIPMGTGHYVLSSLGADNYYLARSNGRSAAETPVVDIPIITLTPVSSSNEIRDSFEFGQTDLVCTDPNSTSSVGYHCNYEVWDCPTTVMQYLGFNRNHGLLSSRALRKTVTHVIDRTAIAVEIMRGYATPAILPCSPLSPFYDTALAKNYDMNVPLFRNALNESGVGGNRSDPGVMLVCADSSTRVAAAQAVADTLEQYGLYVRVSALDHDSFIEALNDGKYDLYYGEVKLTSSFDLSAFFEEDGNLYFSGMGDEELVELCHAALENSGNYRELFDRIMEQGLICPILFKNYAVYMSRGSVSRLSPALDYVMHIPSGRTLSHSAPNPAQETTASESADSQPENQSGAAGNPGDPTETGQSDTDGEAAPPESEEPS